MIMHVMYYVGKCTCYVSGYSLILLCLYCDFAHVFISYYGLYVAFVPNFEPIIFHTPLYVIQPMDGDVTVSTTGTTPSQTMRTSR